MRAVIIAVAAVMFLPVAAIAQISPGRLAQPHQSLEGPTNCARCHGASPSEMPKRCLACHREVAWLIARNRGVHARGADMANRSCGSCHPDHAGSAFEMVAWDAGGKNAFDHRKSGWQLAGKHRTIRCEECHQNQYRVSAGAALSPRKSSPGWMGLETDCASCHRRDDPHQNALGPNCQECHDAAGWAPAPAFDHAKSRYPLTGLHQDVACAQCHQSSPSDPVDASGQRIPRFRPLAHTECSNCHRDPHRGALSARCTSCHVTGGFDVIEKGAFDHSATRYPLQGKHRSARCDDCHGTAMARPRPTFAACANCHADAHAGEGTLAGAAADCAVCHRVEGFRPSTFTVARHAGTQFALAGKHLSVACGDCHTRAVPLGGKVTVTRLRLTSRTCADCHATPHGSQLPGTSCESCHGDAGWATMLYERALHAATALPLDGAHAAASCMSCHGTNRPGLPAIRAEAGAGSAEVVFRLSERTCAECHADPHRADSAGKAPVDCAACHTTRAFRESTVNVADHARFKFALDGAHRAVACAACHTGLTKRPGATPSSGPTLLHEAQPKTVPLRAVKGTSCAACHETPHDVQFETRMDGGRCDACHRTESFDTTPAFDHGRDSQYPLDGAHAGVSCDRCHRSETVGGVKRTRYRPLPHRCEDCHVAKPTRGGS